MRIQEIVFQGLLGISAPVRISAESDVSLIELPAGVRASGIQDILLSIFYADKTPQKLAQEYSSGGKVVCQFSSKGKNFRMLRRGGVETIRLQSEAGQDFQDVADGARVDAFMRQSLGLPDLEVVWSLNFWRYEESPKTIETVDLDNLAPNVRELVFRYREARKIEAAEDHFKGLESKIAERRRELGKGMAIEEKLGKAREKLREIEVSELSPDDVRLLQGRDIAFKDFEFQIDRLAREEEDERRQTFELLPKPFLKDPIFLAGFLIGVVSLGVSIAMSQTPWRTIALADTIGFGMCAWVLLNYYVGLEKANVHQVRLETIKRRLNQIREERVALEEKINHILIHARIDDAEDVGQRVEMAQKLKQIIDSLESQVADLRRDPKYLKGKSEIDKMERELEAAKVDRVEIPPDVLSAYQLESDLDSLGIDANSVVEDSEAMVDDEDAVQRLLDALRRTNQWQDDGMLDKTKKMWAKIASFLLGDRFKDVDLAADGTFRVGSLGAEQVAMWARTRPSEFQTLLVALAISVQVNAPERSRAHFESILVSDPSSWLTPDQAKKLSEVFASAARRTPVLLLKEK